MGNEISGQPPPPSGDVHAFPWHAIPARQKVGMARAGRCVASEVSVGMGTADTVVCRRLDIGMGAVSTAYVFEHVKVGMGKVSGLAVLS